MTFKFQKDIFVQCVFYLIQHTVAAVEISDRKDLNTLDFHQGL
jgi:hypothetical protein